MNGPIVPNPCGAAKEVTWLCVRVGQELDTPGKCRGNVPWSFQKSSEIGYTAEIWPWNSYPLVMTNIAIENSRFIVDLPIKECDFPKIFVWVKSMNKQHIRSENHNFQAARVLPIFLGDLCPIACPIDIPTHHKNRWNDTSPTTDLDMTTPSAWPSWPFLE